MRVWARLSIFRAGYRCGIVNKLRMYGWGQACDLCDSLKAVPVFGAAKNRKNRRPDPDLPGLTLLPDVMTRSLPLPVLTLRRQTSLIEG